MLGLKDKTLIALDEPNSIQSEMYRTIRTNLEYSSIDKEINVINVTSSVANEAKTTTACNLAIMTANKNKKVLLIDLDLRSPCIHRAFNIKNKFGITDMLVDFIKKGKDIDCKKYVQNIQHEQLTGQLYVITSGTEVVNPTEIISSKKIKELVNFLKNDFDEIIIDSAPSGVIIDGVATSKLADGTVFIIERGKTKIDIAQKTIKHLKLADVNVLGVVLTKVPFSKDTYGYYGNGQSGNNNKLKIVVE